MPILDWADAGLDLGRDTALEEYKQELWRTAMACRITADRRIVLDELERLNEQGRKALLMPVKIFADYGLAPTRDLW